MRQSMGMYAPAKFTLKKLPMWGWQVAADDINFEWPTQEMLDQWPEDASLKSITFSTFNPGSFNISSV